MGPGFRRDSAPRTGAKRRSNLAPLYERERAMAEHFNELGQPIGFPLPNWTARPRPPRSAMEGRYCRVEPVDPARHAADLHAAYLVDKEGRNWTYLPHGPYARFEDYLGYLERAAASDDPLIHCVIERSNGRAAGVASYMRIDPAAGVIEVGRINYLPLLQRTPAATEAMYLMMRRVFDEKGPSSAGSIPAISTPRATSAGASRSSPRQSPASCLLSSPPRKRGPRAAAAAPPALDSRFRGNDAESSNGSEKGRGES